MESFTDNIDPWVCPNDRQLALRGRLDTGWSTFSDNILIKSHAPKITESEQDKIVKALCKAAEIEYREQERIGYLVDKVETLKESIIGDGETTCLVCGAQKGPLKPCSVCSRGVCAKCNVENVDSEGDKVIFCIICWEERELWKKSGAWFYKSMPHYVTKEERLTREGSENHYDSISPTMHRGSLDPRGSLDARGSLIPTSLHHSSFYDEEDDSEGELTDESEDKILDSFDSSFHQIGRKSDFNLGIDVNGISMSRHTSREDQHFITPPNILVTPETPLDFGSSFQDQFDQPDGPAGWNNKFDKVDRTGSVDSHPDHPSDDDMLGPRARPRVSSGLTSADARKKLAMKFRRKNKSRSPSASPSLSETSRKSDASRKGDTSRKSDAGRKSDASQKSDAGRKSDATQKSDSVSQHTEEEVDEIFKSYEAQSKASREQPESFGDLGILEFTLRYDSNTLELQIIVNCGKGLKPMDHGKTSDPYVKTHLLPDSSKSTKKRTQTVHRNLNPVFNETLVYHGISEKDINHRILRLSVMDENKVTSNGFIGETRVPLKSLTNRPVQQFSRVLNPLSELSTSEDQIDENPGRIELALHYSSKQQKLFVGILRCAGLKAMDPNGYSDPYVKCYMKPDQGKKSKRKTSVKKKTLNPEFNEEFNYKIAHSELAGKSLLITVWDYDVGTRNDFIGAVTLGIHSSGETLKHWFQTLKTSDRRVTRWHTLSPAIPDEMEND